MVTINKLSTLKIKNLKLVGYYNDGNGLYLQISKFNSKNWVFRYKFANKKREMGLGSVNILTLAEARQKAIELKKMLLDGLDPIALKNEKRRKNQIKQLTKKTFKECAIAYINNNKASWKNRKTEQHWTNTLINYAYPIIGELDIEDIEINHILSILQPLWHKKTETASKLRGRIEKIIDFAIVNKNRKNKENPARWKNNLEHILPKKSDIHEVRHYPRLDYHQIPTFMEELCKRDGISIRALEFSILTATRSNETRGAKWGEIDFKNAIWTIPKNRMKESIEHRIPLTKQAISLLKKLYVVKDCDLMFPSKNNRPLSDMALTSILRKMGYKDNNGNIITQHGFRSTFRDWAGETTNHEREVCEQAIAHRLAQGSEAAYQRGDFFEKRKELMKEWNNYCYSSKKQSINIKQ